MEPVNTNFSNMLYFHGHLLLFIFISCPNYYLFNFYKIIWFPGLIKEGNACSVNTDTNYKITTFNYLYPVTFRCRIGFYQEQICTFAIWFLKSTYNLIYVSDIYMLTIVHCYIWIKGS